MDKQDIKTKSAERRAFERYLRTGQWLTEPLETKFNPYHDPENGRFTFGPGGPQAEMASPPAARSTMPRTPPARLPAAPSTAPRASAAQPRTKPIKDYPETGKHSWRKANDAVFEKAADDFNRQNGLKPGDARYMDPQLMKAWAMVESGGDKAAFLSDPFQVNKPGDAASDKLRLLKGGLAKKFVDLRKGLENYNANNHKDKNGKMHYVNYADIIFDLYRNP